MDQHLGYRLPRSHTTSTVVHQNHYTRRIFRSQEPHPTRHGGWGLVCWGMGKVVQRWRRQLRCHVHGWRQPTRSGGKDEAARWIVEKHVADRSSDLWWGSGGGVCQAGRGISDSTPTIWRNRPNVKHAPLDGAQCARQTRAKRASFATVRCSPEPSEHGHREHRLGKRSSWLRPVEADVSSTSSVAGMHHPPKT